jgi:hypothetical protein
LADWTGLSDGDANLDQSNSAGFAAQFPAFAGRCVGNQPTCALRAPIALSGRIRSASVQKTKFQWRLMREARYAGTKTRLRMRTRTAQGFYPRSPIAYGRLFVRAQSVIRADGSPSAQVQIAAARCVLQRPQMSVRDHCALRAPTLFSVRIKIIRTENTVMNKTRTARWLYTRSPNAHGWLFHPCTVGDPRGPPFVLEKSF